MSEQEIQEIQGAISSGEMGPSPEYIHFRVIYTCPYCDRRHIQKGRQPGTIDDMKKDGGIVVEAKCEQGKVRVRPYR